MGKSESSERDRTRSFNRFKDTILNLPKSYSTVSGVIAALGSTGFGPRGIVLVVVDILYLPCLVFVVLLFKYSVIVSSSAICNEMNGTDYYCILLCGGDRHGRSFLMIVSRAAGVWPLSI